MNCSSDTFKPVADAFWELYDTLTVPDINRTKCVCGVCDFDCWDRHDDNCELVILKKAIQDYEQQIKNTK
jgi:hypothetical protein